MISSMKQVSVQNNRARLIRLEGTNNALYTCSKKDTVTCTKSDGKSKLMVIFPENLGSVKGFLSADEGEALFEVSKIAARLGPILEIGSYCGKSTIYIALGCREHGGIVFAIDHHRGSEEHQIGELFHDPDLIDKQTGNIDSFVEFRKNIAEAGVEDNVVPIVAKSSIAASAWRTPLAMIFIDGGHSLETTLTDYQNWSQFLLRGGFLGIHDVFDSPECGGQAPRAIHDLAIASGLFSPYARSSSQRILRRL